MVDELPIRIEPSVQTEGVRILPVGGIMVDGVEGGEDDRVRWNCVPSELLVFQNGVRWALRGCKCIKSMTLLCFTSMALASLSQ